MLFAMLGDANDAAAAAALGVTTVASAACSACREEWIRSRAASLRSYYTLFFLFIGMQMTARSIPCATEFPHEGCAGT